MLHRCSAVESTDSLHLARQRPHSLFFTPVSVSVSAPPCPLQVRGLECALKIMRKAKLLELGEEHHVLSEVEALDRRERAPFLADLPHKHLHTAGHPAPETLT